MNLKLSILRTLLLLLFIICLISDGISQSLDVSSDSISKYSYTIFGQFGKTSQLNFGTCSFIERNGDLYLITAKHILYTWLSETLKINKQDPPLKMFYDFIDFNTSLFDGKVAKFHSDDLAKNYIEKISIPEYIDEIRERI